MSEKQPEALKLADVVDVFDVRSAIMKGASCAWTTP